MKRGGWALCLVALAMPGLTVGLSAADADPPDWRLDLLLAEGVSADTPKLREMREGFDVSDERFDAAVGRLGAEEFAVREGAEREILLMGKEALPLLRGLPRSKDPEVRARLATIERILGAGGRWSRDDLLRYAVDSLLRERLEDGEGKPAGLLFAEFFRVANPSLVGGYGRFGFNAGAGMTGRVDDGILRMQGNHGKDGGQSLFLTARELTGQGELPDSFRIEVKIGGEEEGEGTYHVGVSVGNVRALFHPGYKTGGFRFERVDSQTHLTQITPMGFTPLAGELQSMSLDVKRLAGGKVEMKVGITSPDGTKAFGDRKVLEGPDIGKLDRIGLERSGRTGGDGLFDDLVIDLGAR